MRNSATLLLGLVLTWSAGLSVGEAGIFNQWNRMLGFGWSDGYHARPYRPHGHRHWQPRPHRYDLPYSSGIAVSPHVVPGNMVHPHVVPEANWRPAPTYHHRVVPTDSIPSPRQQNSR